MQPKSAQKAPYIIYYNPEISSVVMEWTGSPSFEDFTQGTEAMLDLLCRKKYAGVLADLRDMNFIKSEQRSWLNEDFIPRAIEAGLRKCAIVTDGTLLSKMAIENVAANFTPSALSIQTFDTIEAAESWVKIISEERFYKYSFDVDVPCLVMEWRGNPDSRTFREGTWKMIEYLREYKAGNVLGDIEHLETISMPDQRWINEIFLPEAIRSGFNKVAFIDPLNIFNKLSVATIGVQHEGALKMEFFKDKDEARKWLNE